MLYLVFIMKSLLLITNPISWQTNFDEAKVIATEEEKNILMIFAGSDWCGPCIKLKKTVLLDGEFVEYQNSKLILLYLDFPARKKNKLSKIQTAHNEALASIYNASGVFPKIVLLNSDGEVLKDIKYEGQSTKAFINNVELSR